MTISEKPYSPSLYDAGFLEGLRALHADYPIAGLASGQILDLPDELLSCVLLLLRGEQDRFPVLSITQWNILSVALEHSKMTPFFYKLLKTLPADRQPPADVFGIMRKSYLRSATQSVVFERQVREVLAAFHTEDIRAVLLKGSVTAFTLYPDPAMRPLSDIDVLVRPGDMPRVSRVLESLGYVCYEKFFGISRERYHEETYRPRDKNYLDVDVMWNIFPYSTIGELSDVDPLFDRAVKADLKGLSIECLDPVDALVFNASHVKYGHKGGIRLSWIIDVAMICRSFRSPEDWVLLQQRGVDYLARDAVEKVLRMAQYWTGLVIPAEYSDFSKWPAPSEKEVLLNRLMDSGDPVAGIRLATMAPGGLPKKAGHLLGIAFPPPACMRRSYALSSNWELPMAYVRRWKNLLGRS